jgi:SecD/SecF fusion protein
VSARRRNLFILLVVAGMLVASAVVVVTKPTRLGLDLSGGVELVYEARGTPQQPVVNEQSLERAIEVMRERVDRLGVSEPEIQRSGTDQIVVSLPQVENAEAAQRQVGRVAQLFFYDWERSVIGPDGRPDPDDESVTGGQAAGQPAAALTLYEAVQRASQRPRIIDGDNSTNSPSLYLVDTQRRAVVAGPEETREDLLDDRQPGPNQRVVTVQPGTTIVRAETPDGVRTQPDAWYVLDDDVALRGTDIRNPEQAYDQGAGSSGEPIVTFQFTDEGRRRWEQVTREIAERGLGNLNGNQHFAIVLDNELISVPFIDSTANPDGIDGRQGSQIQGGFTIESSQDLANLLQTGALPVRLDLISQSQVSATLGRQALNQGLLAGLVGFGVVALFLLAFYRVLGAIAVGALAVYALFFFALIELIPITLTLPGIAGLILTIGVAADANIVIFERVKEEIRAGRSILSGIATGYKRGLTAIVDANVVTFMVAFILFILATAGIRGFAFTLGVGTLVSFFTAVLFTQAILGTMGRSRLLARPSALGAGEQKHRWTFDFMGASRWFFAASGVILLIGALAIGGKGLTFGIDFESGTRIRTAVERPASEAQIRDVLAQQGYADAEIQRVEDPELGANVFQISTEQLQPNRVADVRAALDDRFGVGNDFSNQSIGPTFGETVANTAIIAIIASLVVISAYIALRFEWKYAVPVLIALMHDLLITAGVYSLVGREVTTSTVAALLTILGFSLYDTIIVFDRVRENVPRMPRAAFTQIVNRSMSEVLTRSLATSFCTVLPVLGLLLFGGETLTDFAFALIVGTASGTYSSVFIASPVLSYWKEREPMWRQRRAAIEAELGQVPAYATSVAGQPVDVAPADAGRRPRRAPTAPDGPTGPQVSREEFDEMVRDLDVDAEGPGSRQGRSSPEEGRSQRRGAVALQDRMREQPDIDAEPPADAQDDDAADARPEDVVMPGDGKRDRAKRARNRRHGRPR